MKKSRVFPLFAVILIAFLLVRSLTIVPTGYTGVKTSFGQIQETTIQSGKLNFTIPFVQSIHTVNNKQQDKHIEDQIWGEASDKTPVYAADVIVTYQVLPEKSAWLYANVSDIKNLLGDELIASAVKSAMSELGPEDVTNRTKVEPLAQQKLAESLNQKYGEGAVFINKVVINDMDFEEAYNAAIQQKSIAQQNAARQKIENEAAIAKAEADKQVATSVTTGWNNLRSMTASSWSSIQSALSSSWNSIKSTASSAVNAVRSAVSSGWSGVQSSTSSTFSSVQSAVSGAMSNLRSTVVSFSLVASMASFSIRCFWVTASVLEGSSFKSLLTSFSSDCVVLMDLLTPSSVLESFVVSPPISTVMPAILDAMRITTSLLA